MSEARWSAARHALSAFTLAFGFWTACARQGAPVPADLRPAPIPVTAPVPALPEIPATDGTLRLTVVYPVEDAQLTARDSNFIFGATGSGQASLSINGTPVPVAPNGAYLAFLPVPADGVYRLAAARAGETVTLERRVRVPPVSGPYAGPVIDTSSTYPRGSVALPVGEWIEVGFTGTAGGRAALVTPSGMRIPLIEQPIEQRGSTDAANFRTSAAAAGQIPGAARYSASVIVHEPWIPPDSSTAPRPALAELRQDILGALGFSFIFERDTAMERRAREQGLPVPSPAERESIDRLLSTVAQSTDSLLMFAAKYAHLRRTWAEVELVVGTDTSRLPLNAWLALFNADPPRAAVVTPPPDAPPDWTSRGRPGTSGPYHWFWPPGTPLQIDGERAGQFRVRLAPNVTAWVPMADVRLLPAGAPPPRAAVTGVRFTPRNDRIDLRIALSAPLPFRVDANGNVIEITVYGATSEVNFLQYGSIDPLLRHAAWSQPAQHVFVLRAELAAPVWGFLPVFDGSGALIVRIRRPPHVADLDAPLRGLLVAIDPGHPPAGGTGPTGLTEAEANLGVALQLKPQLEAAGARVLLTRADGAPVELGARPRLATEMNADLFVSLHNNAFPDGVNPFENHGSSVYYYQGHSADLARLVLSELLAELRLRDIGMGRADLAVVRASWMPAVLSETMFMMVPQQESALRDPAVHRRIAAAHLRALVRFVRARALAAAR